MARLALSPLLAAIIASATLALSAREGCRWRFDSCARQQESSQCSIRLRQWCYCEEDTGCPSNVTIDRNVTNARSSIYGGLTDNLESLCNLSRCSIVPGPCEWGPWKVFFKTGCMIKQEERFRERCCHPTFPEVRLEACRGKRKRQTRMSTRTYDECYGKTVKTHGEPRFTIVTEGGRREVEDSHQPSFANIFFLIMPVFFVLVMTVASCWLKKAKRLRRPSQRQAQNRRVPKDIIIPQPGHPLHQSALMPD